MRPHCLRGASGGTATCTLAETADGRQRSGVRSGHLAARCRERHRYGMSLQPPLDREDVVSIIGALFDIRADTQRIIELLEEDDGQEEEDSEADA